MGALAAAAVLSLAAQCNVPGVTPQRIAAAVQVESGGAEFAIHDNTENRSYFPDTRDGAVILARALLQLGHKIDAGLAQITDANWQRLGLTVDTVFDRQINVCAGAKVLAESYRIERRVSCRYQTGKPECDTGYPERIDRAYAQLAGAHPGLATVPPPPPPPPAPSSVYDGPAASPSLETIFLGVSK